MLKRLIQKYWEPLSFVFFGGLTTVVNFLVYYPCFNLLHLSATVSNVIAWAVAVAFAFVTNKPFVEAPPADEPELMLGDIVLSLEKTKAQAEEFGHSFEREAAFLCVHSMLHLLGYDHVNSEEEDEEMRRRQREILEKMGLGVK